MKIERYPPFNVLQTLLVVARCGNFTAAAQQLFLSQSAVSRHIQQIEEYFGCALFVRHTRMVVPTVECQRLVPIVEELLATARRSMHIPSMGGQTVTLRVTPTLAARWLLPRLPDFYAEAPGTQLNIDTAWFLPTNFGEGTLDAAILFGTGRWDGLEATPLMRERLTPVCSPQMAEGTSGMPPLAEPADLKQHTLLHSSFGRRGWMLWLQKESGELAAHTYREQVFDTLDLAFNAAVRGLGVALGDLNLLQESLASGALVRPFQRVLETGAGYYLVHPPRNEYREKLKPLLVWLQAQTHD
ncbi:MULTISPECIES: LysR substrate-binding domain-containing protein [Paraburkholderia]|uniref:LysR substrate-binding domain-containing protein n=1 Tax=Paraburkholderia TaxID=1822464 RepID=UPI002257B579|nr:MULTISPECIES: LysR substrate-binding domain-containing protein [Paraburkholderia]MCX4161593.1 LysR substrate-binding domain-containing protein [Paraburkholderia megapolitana]MDN7157089.1 LysR substrate-binding domain-containing protein [Paraburkholderia sp. CHISQ3]MDQ6494134.1 LysR substrate-binding domain-containing protein [Paraburkholderia megapolitana]